MKNIFLLFSILIFAQGCSSIAQPKASRPLVEQQFLEPTTFLDSSLSVALANAEDGTILDIQNQAVELGAKFFAASGLSCRKINAKEKGQHIYCVNDKGSWFKVNNVISEYSENELRKTEL